MIPPPLLTIGYEAARFDQVRDALPGAGTRLPIEARDRRQPASRIFQASAGGGTAGGRHRRPAPATVRHAQGRPRAGRDAVRRGDVGTMQRIFAAHMDGNRSVAALAEARAIVRDASACPPCSSRDHARPHRTLVADMLVANSAQPVLHLLAAIDLPPPTPKRSRNTA